MKVFIPVEVGLAVYLIIFRETFLSHCLSTFDALYTVIVPCLIEHLWEVSVHYWQRTSSTNVICHFFQISWLNSTVLIICLIFQNFPVRLVIVLPYLSVFFCVLQKLIFKLDSSLSAFFLLGKIARSPQPVSTSPQDRSICKLSASLLLCLLYTILWPFTSLSRTQLHHLQTGLQRTNNYSHRRISSKKCLRQHLKNIYRRADLWSSRRIIESSSPLGFAHVFSVRS